MPSFARVDGYIGLRTLDLTLQVDNVRIQSSFGISLAEKVLPRCAVWEAVDQSTTIDIGLRWARAPFTPERLRTIAVRTSLAARRIRWLAPELLAILAVAVILALVTRPLVQATG
jgi:hypothetical protein